jgi:TonB family protein
MYASAWAQATATISGTVRDQSGAVLPGVDVTLQDSQEFKWQATTDASGRFEFPPVQPGKYVLEASLMGFKQLRSEFALRDAKDWDRPITLQVGELSEMVTVSTSRKPASAQSAQAAAQPVRVRVGGNIRAPMKIHHTNPVYPDTMRDAGRGGTVPIEAVIGRDGSVLSARVLGAAVHPDFAASALDAVRQWQFSPTLLNGVPVEVVMKVTVNFTLE